MTPATTRTPPTSSPTPSAARASTPARTDGTGEADRADIRRQRRRDRATDEERTGAPPGLRRTRPAQGGCRWLSPAVGQEERTASKL